MQYFTVYSEKECVYYDIANNQAPFVELCIFFDECTNAPS